MRGDSEINRAWRSIDDVCNHCYSVVLHSVIGHYKRLTYAIGSPESPFIVCGPELHVILAIPDGRGNNRLLDVVSVGAGSGILVKGNIIGFIRGSRLNEIGIARIECDCLLELSRGKLQVFQAHDRQSRIVVELRFDVRGCFSRDAYFTCGIVNGAGRIASGFQYSIFTRVCIYSSASDDNGARYDRSLLKAIGYEQVSFPITIERDDCTGIVRFRGRIKVAL